MRPLLVLLLLLRAAPAMAPPERLPEATLGELRQVLAAPELKQAVAGVLVVAAGAKAAGQPLGVEPYQGGRPVLFAHQPDTLLAPASNAKLFTAAAALDTLGADFRFTTRVLAGARRDASVDRLYLVGAGDPSLADEHLAALAAAVKQQGITRVGQVVGDAARYQGRYGDGWAVDDLPWYYAAEISALTLNRNHVDVYVAPGATAGQPARVWCQPASDYLKVDCTVTTLPAGTASRVTFDRLPGRREFVLRGGIALGAAAETEGMAIQDVDLYAAQVFTQRLEAAGVAVGEPPAVGSAPAGARELAQHRSEPLRVLLKRVLKNSDNLYAELLLRELGVATAGAGTAAGGLHGVRAFLERQGIDRAGAILYDGSGLSRYGLVTPRAIVGVLRAMAFHPARQAWFEALPVAGEDGTIARRMRGTLAAANVRAKTGYYAHHTSLSGYVTTRAGDVLLVATLFNHSPVPAPDMRLLHDRFFVALAKATR